MLGLALVAAASAGPRLSCIEGPRLDVSWDAYTMLDGMVWGTLPPWEIAPAVQATAEMPPWAYVPCMRLGVRNQLLVDLLLVDPDGPESGWELHDKLGPMVGGGAQLGRFELSGFLWPGVRIHHVRQVADYPGVDVSGTYRATGLWPTLYLQGVLRVRVVGGVHVHLDSNAALLYPLREYGWYANRVVGVGVSVGPRPVEEGP